MDKLAEPGARCTAMHAPGSTDSPSRGGLSDAALKADRATRYGS